MLNSSASREPLLMRALLCAALIGFCAHALHAIEWPNDELSVYATLRGPLFGFSDDALFAFRSRNGRLYPLRRAAPADILPRGWAERASP